MISINFQEILDKASEGIKIEETPKTQIQIPETTDDKIDILIEFVRNVITDETQKLKFNRLFPKPKK